MKPRQLRSALKSVTGILIAMSVLIGAASRLLDQIFQKPASAFPDVPAWAFWCGAGVLIIIGIWFIVVSRTKRSELSRPTALRLNPRNPEHLVGREEDVELLKTACLDFPLVFMSGESGAGKSALIQAGLVPALEQEPSMLPLYVNIWGQDWERGPAGALADALWHGLNETGREKLELGERPELSKLLEAFGSAQQALGRTPLLIFDQFDDYQVRHRDRFLQRKTWLSAKALTTQNGLWRGIGDLLGARNVSCLFVTRADTADGLESVRFEEPSWFRLDRLRTTFVGQILDRLTSPTEGEEPIVEQPEGGWKTLKARLARDLGGDGFVLPQRLKTVLLGLPSLKFLTVGQYERAGGAAGVEALYVESQMRSAARKTGLSEVAVRRLLLAMVESENQDRTVVRTLAELEAEIAGDIVPRALGARRAVDSDSILAALQELSKTALVRERADPDTGQRAWLLDHGYLTGAVVEIERRANRLQVLLEDGARAFQEAGGGLRRRWRALLGMLPQIRLLVGRVRHEVRYGEHRNYAIWSIARFAPLVLALVFTGLAWTGYQDWRATEIASSKANQILVALGEFRNRSLSAHEINALWDLATADEKTRHQFLELLLTSEQRAARFLQRPGPIVRALVGLSPNRRSYVLRQLPTYLLGMETSISRAAARIALELDASGMLDATRIMGLFDPSQIFKVARKLTPKQAANAVDPLLAAIQDSTGPLIIQALAKGLAVLLSKLTPEQAANAIDPLLVAMQNSTDPTALQALAKGLAALPAILTSEQAAKAVQPLLVAMLHSNDPLALRRLAKGLAVLPVKLKPEQAENAIDLLVVAMQNSTDPTALQVLAHGLATLPVQLTPGQAAKAAQPLLAEMQKLTNSHLFGLGLIHPADLRALAEGLETLSVKLTPEQAAAVVQPLLAAIQDSTGPMVIQALAKGLAVLLSKLTPEQAANAIDPLLVAMQNSTDPTALQALAKGLAALPAILTSEQAAKAVQPLLVAMLHSNGPLALRKLAKGLAVLPVKLKPEQAAKAVQPLLAAMQYNASWALADGLTALSEELTPEQAENTVDLLVVAMQNSTDPTALQALAHGLATLPVKLTPGQAAKAAQPLLAAMQHSTDPDALWALAEGLAALSERLPPEQAAKAVQPLLVAMQNSTDPTVLQALAKGLAALPAILTSEQAAKAVQPLLVAIQRTIDPSALQTLADGLASLADQLGPHFFTPLAIEVLKNPISVGGATSALLGTLQTVHPRAPGFNGDAWKAVAYAEDSQWSVDLYAAPVPPPMVWQVEK